jgi:hypothetical protein
MKKFIELTYVSPNGKPYKGLVNTAWIFDIVPTADFGAKAQVRFAPTADGEYERRYLHTVYVLESYEHIRDYILQS